MQIVALAPFFPIGISLLDKRELWNLAHSKLKCNLDFGCVQDFFKAEITSLPGKGPNWALFLIGFWIRICCSQHFPLQLIPSLSVVWILFACNTSVKQRELSFPRKVQTGPRTWYNLDLELDMLFTALSSKFTCNLDFVCA